MKNKKIVVIFTMVAIMFSIFGKVYAYFDDEGYFYHDEITFKTEKELNEYVKNNNIVFDTDNKEGRMLRLLYNYNN